MIFRFSLYGFLKNQRYFEPFLMLAFLEQGLSFLMIGWLVACKGLTINLLEIPSGAIADSLGRRKAMIVSFVAYVFSFLTFGLAGHWVWFFPAMILFGIGDSFRTGTHKAMIFEWLRIQDRTEERTRVYGFTRSWSKIGSALSAVIAALFVLITGNYRSIFFFAAIPSFLNIINFLGYPKELDGEQDKDENRDKSAIAVATAHLLDGLKLTWRTRGIRRLIVESMSWEGFFHAIKDYLQPVLAIVAMASLGGLLADDLDEVQKSAIIIGIVYCVIYLLSALASRNAHRLQDRFQTANGVTRFLWCLNAVIMIVVAISGWFHAAFIITLAFVALHVIQNLWRPILVSRFDAISDPKFGATILSVESQAQRTALLAFAPLVGWLVDVSAAGDDVVPVWPIGLMGVVIAITMLGTAAIKSNNEVATDSSRRGESDDE